ncbi:hypothetical protein TELCIR_05633 [Teladorsagia circumcincta]|uniref:Uncharacterized protein n=1 Tax=Teladorsagia circumcincta TaxID=45464 RepID=A0A2G9UQ97_TELCI|nr:hypothetical protein TELCIR_05633 [Teladorsagia circumcincta]
MKSFLLAILLCVAYSAHAQNKCYLISKALDYGTMKSFFSKPDLRGKIERKLGKTLDPADTYVSAHFLKYENWMTVRKNEVAVMVLTKNEFGGVQPYYFNYEVITNERTKERKVWIGDLDKEAIVRQIRKCEVFGDW